MHAHVDQPMRHAHLTAVDTYCPGLCPAQRLALWVTHRCYLPALQAPAQRLRRISALGICVLLAFCMALAQGALPPQGTYCLDDHLFLRAILSHGPCLLPGTAAATKAACPRARGRDLLALSDRTARVQSSVSCAWVGCRPELKKVTLYARNPICLQRCVVPGELTGAADGPGAVKSAWPGQNGVASVEGDLLRPRPRDPTRPNALPCFRLALSCCAMPRCCYVSDLPRTQTHGHTATCHRQSGPLLRKGLWFCPCKRRRSGSACSLPSALGATRQPR